MTEIGDLQQRQAEALAAALREVSDPMARFRRADEALDRLHELASEIAVIKGEAVRDMRAADPAANLAELGRRLGVHRSRMSRIAQRATPNT